MGCLDHLKPSANGSRYTICLQCVVSVYLLSRPPAGVVVTPLAQMKQAKHPQKRPDLRFWLGKDADSTYAYAAKILDKQPH
jgi:hypothetical protein